MVLEGAAVAVAAAAFVPLCAHAAHSAASSARVLPVTGTTRNRSAAGAPASAARCSDGRRRLGKAAEVPHLAL
eukprot:6479625-Alexandrium_andersonii.AAC.1